MVGGGLMKERVFGMGRRWEGVVVLRDVGGVGVGSGGSVGKGCYVGTAQVPGKGHSGSKIHVVTSLRAASLPAQLHFAQPHHIVYFNDVKTATFVLKA